MKLCKKVLVSLLLSCTLLLLSIPIYAATPADWYKVKGTYAKDNSNQSNNGTLSLMYLDNDVVMFELFMTKGSESKGDSTDFCLASAFNLDDNGIGIYEHPKTDDVKITFALTDGSVVVKQAGKLPMDLSGTYTFIESNIKVTEDAAKEILEQLPTAATSLNHNNGEYQLSMSNEMVDGWFYDVKANFVDTKALIAEFYIASDMSAVYRVDTDTPVLIWGSAKPMLDATYLADEGSFYGETAGENKSSVNNEAKDKTPIHVNFVTITHQKDSIALGNSMPTKLSVPGNLKYTVSYQSSDPTIAKVDTKGVTTAIATGEATITGMITIDGAGKLFEFKVNCFDKKVAMKDVKPILRAYILWILVPLVIITILITLFVIMKRRNKNHQAKD